MTASIGTSALLYVSLCLATLCNFPQDQNIRAVFGSQGNQEAVAMVHRQVSQGSVGEGGMYSGMGGIQSMSFEAIRGPKPQPSSQNREFDARFQSETVMSAKISPIDRGAAAGLTLAEIGGMMSRELCGLEEEASELESVCVLAKLEMEQDSLTGSAFDAVSSSDEDLSGEQDQFQFDLDMSLSSRKFRCRSRGARRAIGMRGTTSAFDMARKINEAGGDMSTPLDFSDVKEKVWARFLDYFEDLLPDAFARRKVESAKSLQRLGTSCRF
ncbi:unnamed protein product [Calypogeia fissa]